MDRFSNQDKVYCADQMGGWTSDYDGSMGFDFSAELDKLTNKAQESLKKEGEKFAAELGVRAISEVKDFIGFNKSSTIQPTQTLPSGTQVYTKTTTGEPIIQTVQRAEEKDNTLLYVGIGALAFMFTTLMFVMMRRPTRRPA